MDIFGDKSEMDQYLQSLEDILNEAHDEGKIEIDKQSCSLALKHLIETQIIKDLCQPREDTKERLEEGNKLTKKYEVQAMMIDNFQDLLKKD